MKLYFLFFCVCLLMFQLHAQVTSSNYPKSGILSPENNDSYERNRNYGKFLGRVSDRSEQSDFLKVQVENNNVKFFKAGDRISFHIGETGVRRCFGNVQGTEEGYFTISVVDLRACNEGTPYIRRGTLLYFESDLLRERVFMASKHREMLLLQREDFLKQLSEINHFLWTYDQQRVKTATEYDQKLLEVQRMKQKAMDELTIKKQDSITLQVDLRKRLDTLDEQLKFFRVERQEPFVDRWAMDHDLGMPVKNRPQDMKTLD